jgi:NADH-quinone oxidoreductase subunit M
MTLPWLTLLTFLPLAAMPLVWLLPNVWKRPATLAVVILQLLVFGFAIVPALQAGAAAHPLNWYLSALNPNTAHGFAIIEQSPWLSFRLGGLGQLRLDYLLAIDGVSALMVLLTLIILGVAVFASWGVSHSQNAYYALLLLLNTALVGSFLSFDLFLFFIFYEFMLLPLYFLIGIWGGERRQFAAVKFFLFTLFGSVFMLLVLIALFSSYFDPLYSFLGPDYALQSETNVRALAQSLQTLKQVPADPVHTLNLITLTPEGRLPNAILGMPEWRLVAFVVLFIAFAIKLPTVPLHTWLPVAHVEASTPVSVILAGILLKVGGYGLYRFAWGLFPDVAAEQAYWIGLLGVISIVYGALVAMGQQDLKRLIAYSSISHMGFVLLGLAAMNSLGTQGALLQLFNHGINSAMLFLLVGVIYERVHHRGIDFFRGLRVGMPAYSAFVGIAFFASLGLPGLNAFISEMLTLAGGFQAVVRTGTLPLWMPFLGILGVFLSAVYFLKTYQRMFFGEYEVNGGEAWKTALVDLRLREWVLLLPLAILAVLTGLLPMLLIWFLERAAIQV